jgi:hypothetical protein
MAYRLQYLDHHPGCYGPNYGDCWWWLMPDRAYTRIETALQKMDWHASISTAPAFVRGVTRVVEVVDKGRQIARVVAAVNHDGSVRVQPLGSPRNA